MAAYKAGRSESIFISGQADVWRNLVFWSEFRNWNVLESELRSGASCLHIQDHCLDEKVPWNERKLWKFTIDFCVISKRDRTIVMSDDPQHDVLDGGQWYSFAVWQPAWDESYGSMYFPVVYCDDYFYRKNAAQTNRWKQPENRNQYLSGMDPGNGAAYRRYRKPLCRNPRDETWHEKLYRGYGGIDAGGNRKPHCVPAVSGFPAGIRGTAGYEIQYRQSGDRCHYAKICAAGKKLWHCVSGGLSFPFQYEYGCFWPEHYHKQCFE